MVVVRLPDLKSRILFSKLSKGVGHNYYGEPAWPNDILYMFPVVILFVLELCFSIGVFEFYSLGEEANIFATPLEIVPEWYFFLIFNLLRMLSDKFIGVLSLISVPLILIIILFLENLTVFQNLFRRLLSSNVFLFFIILTYLLGIDL